MDDGAKYELQRMTQAIEEYTEKLDVLSQQLVEIEEENRNGSVNGELQVYNESTQSQKDIAAVDALDNIVTLQNQLKIVSRRNQLLANENAVHEKQLRDESNKLQRISAELDVVVGATGWYDGQGAVQFSQIEKEKDDIHDMAHLESTMRSDIKNAGIVNAKLEKVLVTLSKQVTADEERRTKYMELKNKIRVRERDCEELEAKMRYLKENNSKLQLVVAKESDNSLVQNSVFCMESDKEFLSDAVREMKVTCRRQENVVKAQIARQKQLQTRLDAVMKSLREMKLLKEFERNVAKSALVPSASREEPEDVADVLPEDENIPVDTYRLLYKNKEMMETNLARKNMLALEKEAAAGALETRLVHYIDKYNEFVRRDDMAQREGGESNQIVVGNSIEEMASITREVEHLRAENDRLKSTLAPSRNSRRRI